MQYSKFFKPGQKIFLRSQVSTGTLGGYYESLTTFLKEHSPGFFDLFLPYRTRQGEDLHFTPGMPFELLSEAMGLGLRLDGQFLQRQGQDVIRVAVTGELQAYQRRLNPRCDLAIGLRYTRGHGTLRTFREQWEKNILILSRGNPADFGDFPRSRINLSSGGVRFNLKAPVEPGSLCLLLLQPEANTQPICTLAEVLWSGDAVDNRQTAGMRFINILEADKKRLEGIIRTRATEQAAQVDS